MRSLRAFGVGLMGASALVVVGGLASPVEECAREPAKLSALRDARLAIPFVENVGQLPPEVRFTASTFAGAVHVTQSGDLVYALPSGERAGGVVVRERVRGVVRPEVMGGEISPTCFSIFKGSDPAAWRSDIPTFDSVAVSGVDTCVALEVRAYSRNVEKLFHVPAGVDPGTIRIDMDGAEALGVGAAGDLEVTTEAGVVRFTEPVAYQERDGTRIAVEAAYSVEGAAYGFEVGPYDRALPLVIDPLIASTYLGADSNDWGKDIGVHWTSGSVYVTGWTESNAFPTTPGAYDEGGDGDPPPSAKGHSDAFVARLSADLTTLEACTLLGGAEADMAYGLSIGSRGVWVAGQTTSPDFPTTAGVIAPNHNGGSSDGWVAKFNYDLTTLDASTYYGGNGTDIVKDVVAAGGALYLAGETRSTDLYFPERAMQKDIAGAVDLFFATIHENLDQISFQTLLGGSSSDSVARISPAEGIVIAVGDTYSDNFPTTAGAISSTKSGEVDAIALIIWEDYSSLISSTYLGGAAETSEVEGATGVYEGFEGIYVAGYTNAANFPVTKGAYDETFNAGENDEAFVALLNYEMTTLLRSTFLGGSGPDQANGLTGDLNAVYVVGHTSSSDFPATGIDTTHNGSRDVFVAALTKDLGSLTGATYLGSPDSDSGEAVAVKEGTVYVTGNSRGPGFPTTTGAFDETYNTSGLRADAFVTALTLDVDPGPKPVDSFILPKKLNVKHKTKVEKSKVATMGFFDSGSEEVNLAGPATLTVGPNVYQFTGLHGNQRGAFEYRVPGVKLKIRPTKFGSSRGKFWLKIKNADVMNIPLDQPLEIRFQTGNLDGRGVVTLKEGRFKLGRARGAIVTPHLCLYNCKAKIKGGSQDSFKAKLGLATVGGTPDTPPPVTFRLGDSFQQTVPSDGFERDGEKYIFRGPVGGIHFAKLDYGRESLVIKGRKVDVGAFPEGGQAVTLTVKVGDGPEYTIRVRMVRTDKSLRY